MLEGPDGQIEHTAAEGNGPVNALDTALRKALGKFYPEIEEVRLLDYKVRVLGGGEGSAALVRVLIESGDEHERWGTVGVSLNVIEASWQALVDSFEYKLYKERRGQRRRRGARARPGAEPSHGPRDASTSTTTPRRRCGRAVLDAMLPFLGPPAMRRAPTAGGAGARARRGGARGRRRARRRAPSEIVFTSGATEATTWRCRGVLAAAGATRPGRRRRSSMPRCSSRRARWNGAARRLRLVPVDGEGRVTPTRPWRCGAGAALVTVGLANNEIGTRGRSPRSRAALPSRGVLVHVDAVQALGKLPVDVRRLGVDLLSLSAHKLGGPAASARSSCAAAYACAPLLFGGEQERGRRAGTENVAAIVGFGAAARGVRRQLAGWPTTRRLRERLWTGLGRACPTRVRNSPADEPLCRTRSTSASRRARRESASCCSTSKASRSRSARPARPAPASRRTCSLAMGRDEASGARGPPLERRPDAPPSTRSSGCSTCCRRSWCRSRSGAAA